jgi:hypothetical protein
MLLYMPFHSAPAEHKQACKFTILKSTEVSNVGIEKYLKSYSVGGRSTWSWQTQV